MTTKINIHDHAALDAAFAEHVAGWRKYESPTSGGRLLLPYRYFDGDGIPRIGPDLFTRSMDAVLPWLDVCDEWVSDFKGRSRNRHAVFVMLKNAAGQGNGEASTLPHAAVVALLRANGVTVTEDGPKEEVREFLGKLGKWEDKP